MPPILNSLNSEIPDKSIFYVSPVVSQVPAQVWPVKG